MLSDLNLIQCLYASFESISLAITQVFALIDLDKEDELDFFKAWLRAKYAKSIRPGGRGAQNQDFENIVSFHQWVRKNRAKIGLKSSDDYADFVLHKFDRFSHYYLRVRQAAITFTPELDLIYYNAYVNFTLQNDIFSYIYPIFICICQKWLIK